MNTTEMESLSIPAFILGDQMLHERFSMAIEMLARIVVANPRPVTTATLAEALGQPTRTVRGLLSSLQQSGLLSQDEKSRDAWLCSSSLGMITLADIFRSVSGAMPEASGRKKKCDVPVSDDSRSVAQQGVDLLLMQATMAINQVVLQRLQTFDLGRLKAIGSSHSFGAYNASVRAYTPEPI